MGNLNSKEKIDDFPETSDNGEDSKKEETKQESFLSISELLSEGDFLYSFTEEYEDEYTFSPQDVQKLIEFVQSIDFRSILSENDIQSITEANKDFDYGKVGLDSAKVNSKIKKTGTEIGEVIKKEGLTKKSKSKIASLYKKMLDGIESTNDDILYSFFGNNQEKIKNYDVNKIKKALLLDLEVVIINTLLISVFIALFGPGAGFYIGAALVGPSTEETAKAIAIKGGYIKEFTVIFNIGEFSQYVSMGAPVGVRLICVGFHIATTIVQWLSQNEKVQKVLGINKDDEDSKEKCRLFGHIIGWIMHFAWNAGLGGVIVSKIF